MSNYEDVKGDRLKQGASGEEAVCGEFCTGWHFFVIHQGFVSLQSFVAVGCVKGQRKLTMLAS